MSNRVDRFVIEATGLSKVYWDGDRQLEILKDVTLAVAPGEGLAIVGPSGSGKTTLLNIMSGLDQPTSGSLIFKGRALSQVSDRERSRLRSQYLGFVFQFYHLLPELNALENVMFPARMSLQKQPLSKIRLKAEKLLDQVGLLSRSGHYPSELSGGEQQRVSLARALVNDPEIIFCDEPTGNLDPKTAVEVAALIEDLYLKDKKTVIVVTHDPKVADRMSRVWLIADQNGARNENILK